MKPPMVTNERIKPSVNTHTHINIQRGNLNRDFFVVVFSGIRNHFILEKSRHI